MAMQPTGTVTLLFTDVEGSTRLLGVLGAARYAAVLELHRRLLRQAFEAHGGYEVDEEGDAFFVAFAGAGEAVAAAAAAQRALATVGWPEGCEAVRVRMGVHTGEPLAVPPRYVGMDVNRAARMMAAAHGGQVLISESSAALLDGVSMRDLGAHRLKDLLAPIRLYELEVAGLPDVFPPLRSLHRSNLPVAAWPLLGRERELNEIRARVDEGVRLVTLTGPGGSGKTRLALQAAAELSDNFSDGVFFVALAPIRKVGAVRDTVAEAVGLQANDDIDGWLRTKRVLLVLDNLEHLPGVEAVVADLLADETVIFATSRSVLHLSRERELPVEPLTDEAAVELFISRAASVGRTMEADETVAAVCRRLDNLPLALELAAARAKLLSPSALLRRLDAALPLLTGGAHDLPERQRTLRATIEWSHGLLTNDGRTAFRRLSVFRGSFSLEAAEAVTGSDLDQVAALVDQSLLKPTGDERFFLLETIREYAREQLSQAEETDTYRDRHADWYLEQLAAIQKEKAAERFGWVAANEDNLRAILDRLTATDPDRAETALRRLWPFWRARGAFQEWSERTTALLADPRLSKGARRALLVDQAAISQLHGDREAAELAAIEALAATEGTDGRPAVEALLTAATVFGWRDPEEGIRYALEAQALSAQLDDEPRHAVLIELGIVFADAGRLKQARWVTHEARDFFLRNDGELAVAVTTNHSGWFDLAEQDFNAAHAAFDSARQDARRIGYPLLEAEASRGLGLALLALDHRQEARDAFRRMLEISEEIPSDKPMRLDAVAGLALTADPDKTRDAARLRGAITHLRRTIKRGWQLGSEAVEAQLERHLVTYLGSVEWEREQTSGSGLTLDEAVSLAGTL